MYEDNIKVLKDLRIKRGSVKSALTRAQTALNNFDPRAQSITLIEVRQEALPRISQNFDEVQSQIELLHDDLEDNERERAEFEERYYALKSEMLEIINSERSHNSSINLSNNNNSNISMQRAHLPPVSLPKFDGHILEWESFYSYYKAIVHEDERYPAAQKFSYLRSALSGPALDVVKGIPITANNYGVALEKLKQRYDNQSLVIQSHIRAILDITPIQTCSAIELQHLQSKITAHVASLKELGQPVEHWDAWLVTIILRKLDSASNHEWQLRRTNTNLPTYTELEEFISNRCIAFESTETLVANSNGDGSRYQTSDSNSKKSYHGITKKGLTASIPSEVKCSCCSGTHRLYACSKFKDLPTGERVTMVRDAKLCFNCFSPAHMAPACKSIYGCRICKRKHNTLLHFDKTADPEQEVRGEQTTKNSPNISAAASGLSGLEQNYTFLATAVVLVSDRRENQRKCRALLDSGSQVNFISGNLAKSLQLERKKSNLPVGGIGASQLRAVSYVEVLVQSRLSHYCVKLVCHVLPTIVNNLPSCETPKKGWQIPDYVMPHLADPTFQCPGTVDLLIGGGVFFDVFSTTVPRIPLNVKNVFLNDSNFGWIVTGEIGAVALVGIHSIGESLEEDWRATMDSETFSFGRLSKANQKCLEEEEVVEYFNQTTYRDETGRFVVRLPRRDTVNDLGSTITMVTSRFLSLERKLQHDENMRTEYTKFINEYIEMGHMIEVVDELPIPKPSFYLPHHAVIKSSSLTTKLRVVFDASATSSSGLSLNNVLKGGPTVQEDVFGILTRFRKHQYVVTSDVEKMFRQVRVSEDDWNLQRVLWRKNPKEKLCTYQLTTVTYGTTPASFLATQCLVTLAEEVKEQYPDASRSILHDFYMDDLMTGADSVEECCKLQKEIKAILDSAKMPLRKWCSNSQAAIEQMDKSEGDPLFTLEIGDGEIVKSLGLEWKPLLDKFFFTISPSLQEKCLTKRVILADLNKIFDPLGFLAPVLIKGKIFLQQIWAEKMDWDNPLPTAMQTKWSTFYHSLEQLKELGISRKVIPSLSKDIEVHGFCDASEEAYGACVYVRSRDGSGRWSSRLLCSKTRVAPLKGTTIPRLELNGALLLAELVNKVSESWDVQVKDCQLWTDSIVVLSWLNSQRIRLKSYVLNRITQITELTEINQWHHVRTLENPADIISRGISAEELLEADFWWYGPKWMSDQRGQWNVSEVKLIQDEEIPEQRVVKLALVVSIPLNKLFNAFSNWHKLLRSVAWLSRFIRYIKTKKTIEYPKHLLVNELQGAKAAVIKWVQTESFHEEIKALEADKELPRRSKIKNLQPFIRDGLIYVGGRLENSSLCEQQKHPVILPASHKITRLIFEDRHRELLHCGPQALLAEVRRMYWPLRGRIMARSVTSRCIQCIKVKPKFFVPLMAPLPRDRVQCSRPFTITGVDFAGPIVIRSGIRRVTGVKTWIAVFVCFSTRAIHLEAVEDLTSAAFIACLRRFMSRRGKCKRIYSDNGTNFIGAQKELSGYMEKIDKRMEGEGIEWRFNPPSAPHFGGLWENAVKSTKFHLTRIMKDARLTLGELSTLLCQIEACVNSRPMTPISSDPSDLEALTPAHFLIGGPMFLPPEKDLTETSPNGIRRWKRVQYLMQTFWKRWQSEYLPQCQVRGKWLARTRPMAIDDVVIIKGESSHPTKWKLGRVVQLHPGKDEIIRVVTLRTASGVEMRRPTAKLCRLPVQDDEETVENQDFQRGENVDAV